MSYKRIKKKSNSVNKVAILKPLLPIVFLSLLALFIFALLWFSYKSPSIYTKAGYSTCYTEKAAYLNAQDEYNKRHDDVLRCQAVPKCENNESQMHTRQQKEIAAKQSLDTAIKTFTQCQLANGQNITPTRYVADNKNHQNFRITIINTSLYNTWALGRYVLQSGSIDVKDYDAGYTLINPQTTSVKGPYTCSAGVDLSNIPTIVGPLTVTIYYRDLNGTLTAAGTGKMDREVVKDPVTGVFFVKCKTDEVSFKVKSPNENVRNYLRGTKTSKDQCTGSADPQPCGHEGVKRCRYQYNNLGEYCDVICDTVCAE